MGMDAKEYFESIGFVQLRSNGNVIAYRNPEWVWDAIDMMWIDAFVEFKKDAIIYRVYSSRSDEVIDINPALHYAIERQLMELGWAG